MKTDPRYTISLEFCGYPEQRHVVRFCGEWVGQAKTEAETGKIMMDHVEKRNGVFEDINLAAPNQQKNGFILRPAK